MGNTFKTAFLLTALTLLLMAVGRALGGQNGMLLALGIAAVTLRCLLLLRQDRAENLSRSAGHARAVASGLQCGRENDAENRPAHAEDLCHPNGFAECFRHRAKFEARRGRGHPGHPEPAK